MNYGKGRLGLNFSGGGHYNWPQTGSTTLRREENFQDGFGLLLQDGSSESSRLGFRSNAGLEYNINAFNTIEAGVSFRGNRSTTDNDIFSNYTIDSVAVDAYQRKSDGLSSRRGWEYELEFKHEFPKKGQEWSVGGELNHDLDDSDADYELDYLFPENLQGTLEHNSDKGDNLELILQTDYTHPVTKSFSIETGAKATLRDIQSDFTYQVYDPEFMLWYTDPERRDILDYDQDIYAGYFSTTLHFGENYSLITGLRYERTRLLGQFAFLQTVFKNDYNNLLPNITIAKKLGDYNQVKVSYNQRIQRPSQRHINPFVDYNDNRDISFGNPYLNPEMVHQVDLSGYFFLDGNMINVSIYGRQTEDLIENLLRINASGVSESTYENFGTRRAAGMNVFGSLNVGKN